MKMQNNQNKAFIQSFMRQARDLSTNKVFFNRPFVKQLNVMEACFDYSRHYLGKDFLFLQDAPSVRLYIRDVFGAEMLRLFENAEGEMVLDIEHALLFYYYLKAQNHPLMNTATGVVYFIAGHQLDDEFAQLSKVAPKNHITPAFELESKMFRWRRCNHILRKYMLPLSIPEGYTGYFFEQPAIGQISFLMNEGIPFEEAKAQINQTQGGLFYSFMPLHIENMLIPSILSGGFDTSVMDGYYTQTLIRNNDIISQQFTLDSTYNIYNQMIKPYMVEMMGMIIGEVTAEIDRNDHLQSQDVKVYHVSPQRIGILVKEGYDVTNILPKTSKFMQTVSPFDLSTVLNAEHL